MSEVDQELVTIREGVSSDRPLILASWLKGLRYGNDSFLAMDSKAYFKNYHAFLEKLLDRPDTEVRIACLKDAPDVILGYSVGAGDTLHWVFVKARWRGIGLANKLVSKEVKVVSHVTKLGQSILKKRPSVTYNPFV